MKRIVTIQDISCVGKCSLTVALPIISALGVECAVVPTAVLSTHTAFSGFTFHDLTGEIAPIAAHWKQEKIGFDAIYTGYLGSFEQLALVSRFFDDFKTEENLVVIDPVMADNGKLYSGFTEEFAREMAKLCGKADVILPNLTEAAYMIGIPYRTDYTEEELHDILRRLCALGAKKAVLTGISLTKGRLGAMAYSREEDRFFFCDNEWLPVSFHGTGDIFASTVVGALARGKSLDDALRLAVDYTVDCMRETMKDPEYNWYGVNFETALPGLIRNCGCGE